MNTKSGKTTYFGVEKKYGSWGSSNGSREIALPDGSRVRIIDKKTFDRAIDGADKKLIEVFEKRSSKDEAA